MQPEQVAARVQPGDRVVGCGVQASRASTSRVCVTSPAPEWKVPDPSSR